MANSTSFPTIQISFQNPILGSAYIIHVSIYAVLYIPCVIVIFQKPLIEKSCFKIMAAMGILDFAQMAISGPFLGTLSILGVSMVDHYWLCKIGGAVANGTWYFYGSLNIILALNRCLDLRSTVFAEKLFGGKKAWIWVVGCFMWANFITGVFCTDYASLVYHSGLGLGLFEGKGLLINTIWNYWVAMTLPLLYVAVWVFLRNKMAAAESREHLAEMERRVLLQAFLISFLTCGTAITYVVFPLIITDIHLFCIANFIWQMMQGGNCVIYLTLNLTVRNGVRKMLTCEKSTPAAAYGMNMEARRINDERRAKIRERIWNTGKDSQGGVNVQMRQLGWEPHNLMGTPDSRRVTTASTAV